MKPPTIEAIHETITERLQSPEGLDEEALLRGFPGYESELKSDLPAILALHQRGEWQHLQPECRETAIGIYQMQVEEASSG